MVKAALIRHLLSLAIALLLLWWLTHSDMVGVALKQLTTLPASLLLTLLVSQSLSYLCRAGRLFSQLQARVPLGISGYMRLVLLHNLSINVIPFRAGELFLPAALKRYGLSVQEAIATLFWLRIQDALVLAALAIALWPAIPMPLRIMAGIGMLVAIYLGHAYLPSWRPGNPRLARLLEKIRPVIDASPVSWSWCIANWCSKLLGLSIVLAALGGFALSGGAAGALGGELSALLPIQGVAGFGTYEAGVAFLVNLAEGQGRQALASAFALHCLTLTLAILAGTLAWIFLPGHKQSSSPHPESPS